MLNPIIPLANKKLSETFFSLYDRFQKNHSLTLAGKFSIPLNPILGNNRPESQVIARQKTNIQCFVGIQFTPQKGILALGTAQLFTFESENFESIELSLLLDHSEELIIYLKGCLGSILTETGIQINVLSESPRGYSLGFSGTFAGILAEAITTIKQDGSFDGELLQLRSKKDEISHIAYNIEHILKPHDHNAPISFQTIFAEGGPSIFSYKSNKTGTRHTLEKLNGIQYNLEHNLDYGVMYSGIPMLPTGSNQTENGEKNELITWCRGKFGIQIGKNTYKQAMLDVLTFENLEFLHKLDTPIPHPESTEIDEILTTGNQLAKSFEKLDGSSHFLDHIWNILEKNEILKETDIAILPIYTTTRGGSYIWYGKKGIARKNLYLAVMEARKRYPELNMISDSTVYTPICSPEIQIVSDLRGKEICLVSDEKKYLLYGQNSREYHNIHNSRELSHGKLIVDQITRKIYINGEGVNSKEILSQQLTIDLIEKYISGGKMEIHASELPSSSYTQNKNEMMSKIVHPLVRTVLKRLGKNMRINCYGSTLDFTIRFEDIDIDMRTFEKTLTK